MPDHSNIFNFRVAYSTRERTNSLLDKCKSLPKALQARINQRKLSHDKAARIQAWLLLREYIEAQGLNHDTLFANIQFSAQGKPSFDLSEPPFYFNFSYAYDMVICAISHSNDIGVDIEKIMPFDFKALIIYFNAAEQGFIKEALNPAKAFYTLWTKKEAFLKCTGDGITIKDLTSIEVLQNNLVHLHRLYNFYSIDIDNSYAAHICMKL